jgi:hypothetical protein
MIEPQPLIDFINLGRLLVVLHWPIDIKEFAELRKRTGVVPIILETAGFGRERQEFLKLMATMSEAAAADPAFNWQVAPSGTGRFFREFIDLIRRIYERMDTDLASQRVLLLDQGVVTERLRQLQNTITGEENQIIFADTLRCLETGAYRAAIVMGWNLAYEHLRQWIFRSKRKRLKAFNAELTSRKRNASDNFDPVREYTDFHDLKESMTVDVAFKAKLFDKQKWQVLTAALNDRNHFAHPSSRKTTGASATGYIENLIFNILDEPHFAYD